MWECNSSNGVNKGKNKNKKDNWWRRDGRGGRVGSGLFIHSNFPIRVFAWINKYLLSIKKAKSKKTNTQWNREIRSVPVGQPDGWLVNTDFLPCRRAIWMNKFNVFCLN